MYVVSDVTLNMKGLKHEFKYMNIDTSGYVSKTLPLNLPTCLSKSVNVSV